MAGLWLELLFIIIGIIMIVLFIKKKTECTAETEATIIDIEEKHESRSDSNGNYRYETYLYPTYEYIVDGKKYIEKSSSNLNGAFIGKKVKLHYNPQNPEQFYSKNDVFILFVVGIAFIAFGIFAMISTIKSNF